jgi:hypothetical protein
MRQWIGSPFVDKLRMARKARVEFEGALYHVMDRGDRREAIFGDGAPRERFLLTAREGNCNRDIQNWRNCACSRITCSKRGILLMPAGQRFATGLRREAMAVFSFSPALRPRASRIAETRRFLRCRNSQFQNGWRTGSRKEPLKDCEPRCRSIPRTLA